MMKVDRTSDIRQALALHRSGDAAAAEKVCRRILSLRPDDAQAVHLLGLLRFQAGDCTGGKDLLRRATELDPENAVFHLNAAKAMAARETGAAIGHCRQAVRLRPDHGGSHQLLGDLLCRQGHREQAVRQYEIAIRLEPANAEAHHHLGIALKAMGRPDEAVAAYRRAVALRPDFAEAWNDLGVRLKERGEGNEAVVCYHRALQCRPDFAEARNNLGVALLHSGDPHGAASCFEHAAALKPDDAEIHLNLGAAFKELGRLNEAIAQGRTALSLRPDWEEARFHIALTRLVQGDFERGWRECENRWERRVDRGEFDGRPTWNGSDPAGRRILLHARHGFGDAIQFIRYAPLLAARGARVLLRCRPELVRLMRSVSCIEAIGSSEEPVPPFDLHCSLMSLPRLFGTTLRTVPVDIPYLRAEETSVAQWRRRSADDPPGLRIGLTWAGSREFREDRFRSTLLSTPAPLGEVEGAVFYSLQKGYAAEQTRTPPAGLRIIDRTEELRDFADTAALISDLDLVISTDTAVVHLAGALGRPVWVLLHHAPGCFWLAERSDSPWYPTMRLFRQTRPGDWDGVIRRIVAELRAMVSRGR